MLSFLALYQNASFYGGECYLFILFLFKNMLVKPGLFYMKGNSDSFRLDVSPAL